MDSEVTLSFSKNWEEEQARRYNTSDDAVCADCFHDSGIKAYIGGNLDATECSLCECASGELIAASADGVLSSFYGTFISTMKTPMGTPLGTVKTAGSRLALTRCTI